MRWFKLITLLPEDKFYEYMRVDRRVFIYLVRQYQRTNNTSRTQPMFSFIFIAMGLNRLGHGLSFRQLGLHFGYSFSHAQKLFTQFLDFVNRVLLEKWVIWPDFEMCQVFKRKFRREAGIPGVDGAMDGTYIHCQGQGPHCEDFRNRKGLFSIIAQLICDCSGYIYDFYVGWPGSVNDARVFQHSPARHKIELGGLYDFVIVSDAAYGLRDYIHTPYRALPGRGLPDEQRVWNLQQSRARMIIEQVNGRLKSRWRMLDGRLECDIFCAPQYVSACIVLHNIDLLLGPRPRLLPPRERNTWWQEGPAAEMPHFLPREEGFTPARRRARMAACLYASWRLGHPEQTQPTLGYVP
ncbi:unnamed protein product [Closterium sp. Yama58-4]|nr:unnamed protein product [Closterium sp. Yama58-4]